MERTRTRAAGRTWLATLGRQVTDAVLLCLMERVVVDEARCKRSCTCPGSCADAKDQEQSMRSEMSSHLQSAIQETHFGALEIVTSRNICHARMVRSFFDQRIV